MAIRWAMRSVVGSESCMATRGLFTDSDHPIGHAW